MNLSCNMMYNSHIFWKEKALQLILAFRVRTLSILSSLLWTPSVVACRRSSVTCGSRPARSWTSSGGIHEGSPSPGLRERCERRAKGVLVFAGGGYPFLGGGGVR